MILREEWTTDDQKVKWLGAVDRTSSFVNDILSRDIRISEIESLKIAKRDADSKLRKEEERRRKAEKGIDKLELEKLQQIELEDARLIQAEDRAEKYK